MAEPARKEIDLMEAVNIAKRFAAELYSPEEARHMGLEGIAKSEDGERWFITLGFSRPWDLTERRTTNLFTQEKEVVPKRVYKVFEVSTSSGEILAVTSADDD